MEKLGTDSRLNLAVRAASEVVAAHGLSLERALVLQDLSNVIMHLVPTPMVARVATTTGTVRQGIGLCRSPVR